MAWIIYGAAVLALIVGPVQSAGGVAWSAGWQLWSVLQLACTTCLALTLLWGPGLVWMQTRERAPADLALAVLPGPMALAVLGVVCWLAGQWQDPVHVARAGIAALLVGLAWGQTRVRHGSDTGQTPRGRMTAAVGATIAAGALVVGFAVAKANFSTGPAGELYGGTISRTLEVGGHADSRISFHVVQLVANNFPPFTWRSSSSAWRRASDRLALWARDAPPYFAPWTFASRGPVAGLVAAPIAMATGAVVPQGFPDDPWQPFDRQGFAAYRIALIVLASLTAWAIFGLAAAILPSPWPLVASTIALLSPFFAHELYFTWPKLAAAGAVVTAFALAYRGRPLAAGLALGYGYLLHPLAILSVPVIGLWVLVVPGPKGPGLHESRADLQVRRERSEAPDLKVRPTYGLRIASALAFGAGVFILVAPWVYFGIYATGDTASQGGFLTYFRMADGRHDVVWAVWLHDRWQSFANTFIPFHLLTFDQTNRSINALNTPSDGWVRAGFLYWNTLPFALGLPACAVVAAGLGSALRRAAGATLLTVVAPALFLTAYWGDSNVGLMRFCGHVLFASVIVLGTWGLGAPDRKVQGSIGAGALVRLFLHPVCFAWRAVEVAVMAFGTTLLARQWRLSGPFRYSDAASLVIAAACLAGAAMVLHRAACREFAAAAPETAQS